MTNHAAFAYADVPLFFFHLLEFSGIDFDLDIEDLNRRWKDPKYINNWSQLVMKHIDESVDIVEQAPQTGIYRMDENGQVSYHRFEYRRMAVESESEAYWLRITGPGDYRYEGADLGILITRGRSMTDEFKLNVRAEKWIKGIKALYSGKPLGAVQAEEPAPTAGSFKIL
jgi:hypothetical protein